MTEQTYVDEVEMEEEGIAELFMEDNAIADVASKLDNGCVCYFNDHYLTHYFNDTVYNST